MAETYVHHRITAAPSQWKAVSDRLRDAPDRRLADGNGKLYGLWRSQIGRPRDEVTAMTVWPDPESAVRTEEALISGVVDIRDCESERMVPTLRPDTPAPPHRQGNYAFRWFETPAEHWDEFLELCAGAWPGFESAYDSQVIGLWRSLDGGDDLRRSLLVTRRPNLAMWERSKIPEGEEEMEVRRKLNRRYEVCDWTVVFTTTLITADDQEDTARWT